MLPDLQPWGVEWPVNTIDPVNRQHPLNQRRVGWWLPLPGQTGGQYVYDLMGLSHGQNNLAPGGTSLGWAHGARPGALVESNLQETTASQLFYVDCGNSPQLAITDTITVACWAKWPAGSGRLNDPLMSKWGVGTAWVLLLDTASADKMEWAAVIGGVTKTVTSPLTYAGGWHRFLGTYDGAALRLYVDGLLVASTACTGAIGIASDHVLLFNYTGSGSSTTSFVGSIDDATIWSRALSAAEARQDYDLSRAGYPGVLNRMPLVAGITVAATGRLYLDGGSVLLDTASGGFC